MSAQSPPFVLQSASHSAELFRRALQSLVGAGGVVGSADLAVSANGTPNMSVNVAAGQVWIPGSLGASAGMPSGFTSQGAYYGYNDGTVNLTISAANATNPRIDLVVATVQDQEYSGSNNQWVIQVITGTPQASPVAPAAPSNSVSLAQVAVAANATQIVAGNITDTRPVAGLLMGRQPWALAQASAASSIPNATNTPVGLGTLVSQAGGFTLVSNALTVPVAGTYLCVGSVNWTNNNAAGYQAMIGHNGAVVDGSNDTVYGNPSTAGGLNAKAIYPITCAAGDTLSLWTYQNAGGPISTDSGFLDRTFLFVRLIST